jgi:hypothetical protein
LLWQTQRVKTSSTIALDDHVYGSKILHGKTKGIKFNRNLIVSGILVNKNKIFNDIGRHKNVVQMQRMILSSEESVTGGGNRQQ